MKFLVQEEVLETVGNKPVPPAEMVPDEQYRAACRVDAALKNNIIEMPPEPGPCIKAEEPDKEWYMSRFYYHFELITGTSDLGGLRYESGITGSPPSSAGLKC